MTFAKIFQLFQFVRVYFMIWLYGYWILVAVLGSCMLPMFLLASLETIFQRI